MKRCLGIPGDTLEIINGIVYINGNKNILPERAKVQYIHYAYSKKGISSRRLISNGYEDFNRTYKIENITENSYQQILPYIIGRMGNTRENFRGITSSKGLPSEIVKKTRLKISEILEIKKEMTLTLDEAKRLKKINGIDSVVRRVNKIKTANEDFFPNRIPYNWNEDNFGPIVIPKKGMTININKENNPLYKKIINEYEKNNIDQNGIESSLNTSEYTFKMDYYWMMGDNRHKSEDSRFWGFVPDDHIVGKPIFIWFSIKGINDGIKNWSIRWDRVFSTVDGPGKRISYFPYFLFVFILWQGFSIYQKRKKKKIK